MSNQVVMTDHVGAADVEEFMNKVLCKHGITLSKIGLIALSPVKDPKDIFVAMEIRVPIGSVVF